MQPTLLVLAAGMGSRFGGLKQFEPVGPGGETLLDYAVFDAVRAGFRRAVFVIRREFAAEFREKVGDRYAGRVAVDYVFQELGALPAGSAAPAGREKPWGTGHAVWCARDAVRENFAVINADDFYGAEAFRRLADFLRGRPASATCFGVPEFAMAGYHLANTVSQHGAVSRGVCAVAPDGKLVSVVEHTGIAAGDVGAGKEFSGDETVSMNCWALTPAIFPRLEVQLRSFVANRGAEPKAEFYLPTAISEMITRGETNVRVLRTEARWFGVTYREDKARVMAAIAELVGQGIYPARLF